MAISIADLNSKELPQDDWIIEGLLTRGNTGFVMGQPKKACKSWLLLDGAWNLSEGVPLFNVPSLKPKRKLRTVYFTQEDTERNIQDRIRKHTSTGREPSDRLWIVPKNLNLKLDTDVGIRLIAGELAQVREKAGDIDLVIFDPMRRIHDGEENDSQTIAKLWSRLDAIHNTHNCATLIAHHIAKPPQNREEYDPTDVYNGRGSGDIYGGGDAFVMVVPGQLSPDGKSYRTVRTYFESKRGEQIEPAQLKVHFTSGKVEYMGNLI